MSIQGLSSSSFFSGVSSVSSAGASGISTSTAGDSAGASGVASMSKRGQFLSQLQSLEQSDPAAAKKLLTDLAAKFRGEASQGGDSRKAAMADKLQKAADTGDLSGLLKTSQSAPGWSRGAGAYGQTMSVTRASM